MKELKLKIAGIGISIEWEVSRIIDWPHPSYQHFVFHGKADLNLRVHCDRLPEYSKDEMLFDGKEEGYWKLYRDNSRHIIEVYDTITHKKSKVCLMELDFSGGDVYIKPELERLHQPRRKRSKTPFWSLPRLMQPLVELLLVNLLAKQKGIMVHGLGINDRGRGIAFLGGTGTGKSTLAESYRSEERVNILSDEHIIIRKEKDGFWLYGTPWPGMAMAASPEGVPLNRIFFIEHASENRISGQGTIADLLPLLFLPFWDRIGMEGILKFCQNLIKKIECKKLGFVKDKSVIDFVRHPMSNGKFSKSNK